MKFFSLLFIVLLVSCNEDSQPANPVFENKVELAKDWTFKKALEQTIKLELSIEEKEKYDSTTIFVHLNDDGILDAVTTVCLLERALKNASKQNNPAKLAESGYVGNYNYFFVFNGATKRFSSKKLVASSPKAPLKVGFCNIESMQYKTITIDYKFNNAIFRSWYSYDNGIPLILFQWKLFEKLAKNKFELKSIEYETNVSATKENLAVYDGELLNSKDLNDENFFLFWPKIVKSGKSIYVFHYDEREKAYMVPKSQVKEDLDVP